MTEGGKIWNFTTKEAYISSCESEEEDKDYTISQTFKSLWGNFASKRVQAIVWKALKQRLPTKENLIKRNIIAADGDISCTVCGAKQENSTHLLLECCFATNVWSEIYRWIGVSLGPHKDPIAHFLQHKAILGTIRHDKIGSTICTGVIWAI